MHSDAVPIRHICNAIELHRANAMQVLIENCKYAGMSSNMDPVARQLWFSVVAHAGILDDTFAK